MKVTIKFYSNWAIGSGKGGNGKDSVLLLDDNGLPFLPGRTFKGLVRDAFLECGNTEKEAIKLFGHKKNKEVKKENLKSGILRFNSAYLPESFQTLDTKIKEQLFGTKTSTCLEDNKQAKDPSLRKNEVCIPVELHTHILVQKDNSELKGGVGGNFEKITQALKMLKFLGKKRHRGFGRCEITVEKKDIVTTAETKTTEKIKPKQNEKITKNTASFICKVTEPLILVKKEKSGQNTDSLDYIPGNTFRGIVAGAIANDKEKSANERFNDIIFNNTVQFGDAHLIIDNKRSLKTPFSFFYDKKADDEKLYNFHFLKPDDWVTKKLKSQKSGYLIETSSGCKIENISYGNRIKSSRNRENRSSEDGGMFSYHYIKKGQEFEFEFEFEITSSKKDYLTKIVEVLDGKTKYFGKSKTAEFGGAIEIKFKHEKEKTSEATTGKYLYAESNLCFLNKYGEFTATPSALDLTGTAENVIDWENSQIKFRTYTPYNLYRQNYDCERLIIEKGSVFAFKKDVEFTADFLNEGIGCFKTEGYGRILVNPKFLNEKEVNLHKENSSTKKTAESTQETLEISLDETNSNSLNFIINTYLQNEKEIELDKCVTLFSKKKYFQKSSSQWARVFNATTKAANYDDLKLFLSNTGSKSKERDQSIFTGGLKNWGQKDIDTITDFLSKHKDYEIIALRKLSKKMIAITKKMLNDTVSI